MKAKKKSRLAMSMKVLRDEGFIVAKTERWNPYAKKPDGQGPPGIRQDLFGFIDLISLPPKTPGILEHRPITAVQVVNTHLPEHIQKIRENPAAHAWVECGGDIHIHNWKQRSKNKVKRMELEVIEVTL